ncbi:metalloregulator ArsR/SmtB family transcription factor [Antrihabitans stalactiti]|uniref:Winged helix-turn-helix transcriptional regulator n=1 Tax=Antrihabitans stalactiti TaxID=2584121 RepID=A0A848KIL5_9NOCA|nr:winged helix-turn-helix transcriptional regulator [Antrihabitans stalactiti]
MTDLFTVMAQPQRRRILEHLRVGDASVGQLVDDLELPQPTISKHLKVLRDSGFVNCRTAAQQRIYSLDRRPFTEFDAWLEQFRTLWTDSFNALAEHLDSKGDQ